MNSSSPNSGESHGPGVNVLVLLALAPPPELRRDDSSLPESGGDAMHCVVARLMGEYKPLAEAIFAYVDAVDAVDNGERLCCDDGGGGGGGGAVFGFLSFFSGGTCSCRIGGSFLIFGPEVRVLLVVVVFSLRGATGSRPAGWGKVPGLVSVDSPASSSPSITPSCSRIRCTLGLPLISSTGGPSHLWPVSERE